MTPDTSGRSGRHRLNSLRSRDKTSLAREFLCAVDREQSRRDPMCPTLTTQSHRWLVRFFLFFVLVSFHCTIADAWQGPMGQTQEDDSRPLFFRRYVVPLKLMGELAESMLPIRKTEFDQLLSRINERATGITTGETSIVQATYFATLRDAQLSDGIATLEVRVFLTVQYRYYSPVATSHSASPLGGRPRRPSRTGTLEINIF